MRPIDPPARQPLPPTPACSNEAVRALLTAMPDAVVVIDDTEHVLFATPATQRILLRTPEELVGGPLGITLVTDEAAEVGLTRPDGSHAVIEMRVQPFTWEGQSARVVTLRDVTERARIEDAARHGIAREVGRTTCARIARDFRDLLTTVLCGAQLLEEAAREDEALGALAHRVVASAREATQLTKQLLSVSGARVQSGVAADLDETVRAFESRMRPLLAEGLDFDVALDATRAQVTLEPQLLDEILAQLVQNACDASPRGGQLKVTTHIRGVADGADGFAPGRYAVLTVRDEGRGMSRETKEHLFEPYYSTKGGRRGRGLGLAQVYGLVEQVGGFIEIESARDQGTRIEVLLPLLEGTGSEDVPTPRVAHAALADRLVLLAEDEEGIRRLLGEVLEHAGATVTQASNVHEARAILDDPSRPVDLLISDVRMPDGSGLELVRAARDSGRPDLPAILISGYSAHMPLGAVPPGPTEFLPKPFLPGALLEIATGLLTA
ncbi:MAG: ATP-binding protein [Planctomycetota bacterium]|nr:ATP-binding protein [Planctomycetota bacterium]